LKKGQKLQIRPQKNKLATLLCTRVEKRLQDGASRRRASCVREVISALTILRAETRSGYTTLHEDHFDVTA